MSIRGCASLGWAVRCGISRGPTSTPSARWTGGFDILLTHSPAYQLGDGQDLPHTGFRAFNALLERYNPRYFVHGHTHMTYGRSYQRRSSYRDTQIINAFERYRFEY